MTSADLAWAERVLRLIGRLRGRGVDEDELRRVEVELLRIVGGAT